MNDLLVIVNGMIQSSDEYIVHDGKVSFARAPELDSHIAIRARNKTVKYYGNGSTNVFSLPKDVIEEIKFQELFKDVWIHKDDPRVKDQLEKLKIVVELIK